MSQPLVSVALATYNGAPYLRQQLDSIYRQSWQNLEVVATDDSSTDGTAAILEDYAHRRGLRFEVNPHRLGLVRNFERAVSLCRGEYIALSDQDDLWKEQKIERLMATLGGFTLVYCNSQETVSPRGERFVDRSFETYVRFARAHGTGRPTRFLLAENWVVSHGMLFRRELAGHALPIPPHQPFHDGWLALVASTLDGIRYLDECLQIYRQHPGSVTYVEPGKKPRRRPITAFFSDRFRADWQRRCKAETARLEDALTLPLLTGEDREFVQHLLRYYESGLQRGRAWSGALRGLEVAPFFPSVHASRSRWKVPLRALLGGR